MSDAVSIEIDETEIQVFWSEQDREFVAIHPQFALLSYLDPDRKQAEKGMRLLLQEIIEDIENESREKTSDV